MILDSSAVLAVLLREPGHELLLERLEAAAGSGIGGPTVAEAGIVLTARMGPRATTILARFIQERELVVIAFGDLHWQEALDAFARFGKGIHPAGLNFGDCMAYATARLADEPLLCLGDDFAKTDLELA